MRLQNRTSIVGAAPSCQKPVKYLEPLVSPLGARPREGLGEDGQDVIAVIEFEAVPMRQELPAEPHRQPVHRCAIRCIRSGRGGRSQIRSSRPRG